MIDASRVVVRAMRSLGFLMVAVCLTMASSASAKDLKIVGVLGSGLPIYEVGTGRPIGEIRRVELGNHLPIPIIETSSMGPYVIEIYDVKFATNGTRVWVNPADVELNTSNASSVRCGENMGRTTQQATGRGFSGGCSNN